MDKRISHDLALEILDNIRGLTVIDTDQTILYIDPHYAKRMGFTQEEAIGRPLSDIVYNSGLPNVLKTRQDEWGRYIAPIGRNGNTGIGSVCNRVLLHPGGDDTSDQVIGAMSYSTIRRGQDTSGAIKEFELLQRQNAMLRSHIAEVYRPDREMDEILGTSFQIQEMKDMIRRVARTSATVCILGETGTGKELAANAIHKLSQRLDKPFVKINCAAIPKDLMESELFGYEPGAFTGASRQGKIGKFELANGGTLLLDEIGEMSLNLQAKLLRVLQAGEVERVGGTSPVPIDVRIICSTNRNLQQMVQEGQFRADLYYRINVMEVHVPSLRERAEDLPVLTNHFISQMNHRHGLAIQGVDSALLDTLYRYSWPGNVRELEHYIERACILCGSGYLNSIHFKSLFPDSSQPKTKLPITPPVIPTVSSSRASLQSAERDLIIKTLEACGGNRTEAAETLHIARSTLYRKMQKYGIAE